MIAGRTVYNYGKLYSKGEYDAGGRLLRETCYDTAGAVSSVTEYTYSGDGNTVSGQSSYYDELGNVIYRSESEEIFDANGYPIRETTTDYDIDGNIINKYETENVYTYENDKLVQCDRRNVMYNEYGEEFQQNTTTAYAYDESGNQQITQYDESGAVTVSEQVSYDENGNIYQVQGSFYENGSIQSWWDSTYNILGDPVLSNNASWLYAGGMYSHEYVYEYAYTGQ